MSRVKSNINKMGANTRDVKTRNVPWGDSWERKWPMNKVEGEQERGKGQEIYKARPARIIPGFSMEALKPDVCG